MFNSSKLSWTTVCKAEDIPFSLSCSLRLVLISMLINVSMYFSTASQSLRGSVDSCSAFFTDEWTNSWIDQFIDWLFYRCTVGMVDKQTYRCLFIVNVLCRALFLEHRVMVDATPHDVWVCLRQWKLDKLIKKKKDLILRPPPSLDCIIFSVSLQWCRAVRGKEVHLTGLSFTETICGLPQGRRNYGRALNY